MLESSVDLETGNEMEGTFELPLRIQIVRSVWMGALLFLGIWISCAAAPLVPSWCPPQIDKRLSLLAATDLIQQAQKHAERGENQEAIARLCEAYLRPSVQRDKRVAGNIANFTGTILFRGSGELESAKAAFSDSLANLDPRVHPSEVATAYANLANVYFRRAAYQEAERHLQDARTHALRIPDKNLRASVVASIAIKEGLVAEAKGQLDSAAVKYNDAYQQALRIGSDASSNELASTRKSLAEAMHNLAALQTTSGHFAEAIGQFFRLRQWARDNDNVAAEYWTTYSLVVAYQALERHREALALTSELDILQRRSPDAGLRASTQMAIAKSLYMLRDLEAAKPRLLEAANYFAEQRMANELAQALNGMGILAMESGNVEEAEQAYSRSLRIRRMIEDSVGEGITLHAMADLAWRRGQTDHAHELLGEAVQVLSTVSAPVTYAQALGSYAVSLRNRGQKQKAKEALVQAVDLLWRYRSVGKSLTLSRNENDRVAPIYDALIAQYLEEKDPLKALEIAERVRAASLRVETAIDPTTSFTPASPDDSKAFDAARSRVFVAMRSQQSDPGPGSEARLAAAIRDLDAAVAQIELATASSSRTAMSFASTVQALQAALSSSRAVLMFYKVDGRWIVWTVTDKELSAIPIAVSPQEVSNQLNSFRQFAWDDGGVPKELQALHRALLEPVQHVISGREIIVVPSGELNQLPFAGLHDGSGYLIQKTTVTHALGIGHATQLLTAPASGQHSPALLLSAAVAPGFARLANADAEVQSVAEHLPSPTIRFGAQVNDFITLAPVAAIIHVAAHGVVDLDRPLLSRLVLTPSATQDGLLSVADVRRIQLRRHPLVVLSACESGVGVVGSDETVHGLAGAFFQAGASAVVASLWLVDDASTAALMSTFYEQLTQGTQPASALRGAMLQAMTQNQHPYYWASFSYTGHQ
jgi:CHAT domain-containing protein